MTQEIHSYLFTTNQAEIKKAEEQYKRLTDQEKTANRLAIIEAKNKSNALQQEEKRFTRLVEEEAKQRTAAHKVALQKELADQRAAQKQMAGSKTASIGLSGNIEDIKSWRELAIAIKNAKTAVLEFGAGAQMVGSNKTYGAWLNELSEKKQLVQRSTKQTSEQLIAMSRDLTVVGLGMRNLISDVGNLTSGNKSFPELALGIAGVTTQALIMAPAIEGVGKGFKAMGGAAMFLGTSVLPTLLTGIAAVAAEAALMVNSIKSAGDMFGRLTQVLSGQMSYWDALKENIKDVTGGIIDLDTTADNFDSAEFQQQLSDIAYLANFSAMALDGLRQSVASALEINLEKFRRSGMVLPPQFSEEDLKRQTEELKRVNAPRGRGTPRSSPTVQIQEALKSLVEQQNEELAKQKQLLEINKGDLGAELEIKKQILAIEERISFLKTGTTMEEGMRLGMLERNRGLGTKGPVSAMDSRGLIPDLGPADEMIAEQMKKQLEIEKQKSEQEIATMQGVLGITDEILGLFGQMPKEVEVMLSLFGKFIEGLSGGGSFGFLFSLLGLIPGGGVVAEIGKRAGQAGQPGGMPSGGNYGLPTGGSSSSPLVNNQIIIRDVVSLKDGLEITERRNTSRVMA